MPCCPECGAPVPADAPRGLCLNCLLNSGLAAGVGSRAPELARELDSIVPVLSDAEALSSEGADQAGSVSLPGFRQAVVELGLVDAEAFDRMASGFASDLAARGVSCTPPRDLRWGVLTQLTLPGGGTLGVYEPRHPRPPSGRRAKSKPAPLKTKSVGTKRRRRRKG